MSIACNYSGGSIDINPVYFVCLHTFGHTNRQDKLQKPEDAKLDVKDNLLHGIISFYAKFRPFMNQ
jgi:hypothetical protein